MQGIIFKSGLSGSAVFAGMLSFLVLYALGAMLVVFAMAMVSGFMDSATVQLGLRAGGYISLTFPAYVAARIAGIHGWRHGMVLGVLEAMAVLTLMTFTFSWDGTLRGEVLVRMLPVFLGVFTLGVVGGGLGEWRNRHTANHQLPNLGHP